MAKIKESKTDQVFRKILTNIKRFIKLWAFFGVLIMALFYTKNMDEVRDKVPAFVDEMIWGWYVPPSKKR